MLGHVAYERVALMVAYDCFKKTGEKSVPLIESFLVHARNGFAFLYKKAGEENTHPNDVFAGSYVAGWSETPTGGLGQAYRRMHVQLAHLSNERAVPSNSYGWDRWVEKLPSIFEELDGAWIQFAEGLAEENRLLFAEEMEKQNRRLRGT